MARKYVYFTEDITKLGPQYSNCNERQTSCTSRKARPRDGCPNCEYTIRYKLFNTELASELATLKRGTRAGARKWPLSFLLNLVSEVASMSYSDNRDGWTVVMSQLVGVYKSEEAKKRAIDNYTPPTTIELKGPLIPDGD